MKRTIKGLLEDYLCVPTVRPQESYTRVHDDCDGDSSQRLIVWMGHDGDMWIDTNSDTALRFRMPLIGGGRSHRTRNALILLAEAIRLDNEEDPFGNIQQQLQPDTFGAG